MNGQMDRGKRLKSAFDNTTEVIGEILDDPEKMAAAKKGLQETAANALDKGTEALIDMTDGATETLEGLTKDDLTVEKINELAQKGPDAVVEAIKSAGFLASFAGGPAGIAGMLTRGGGAAIYQHLNKPPEAEPAKEFNFLKALMTRDFTSIGTEIKSWFTDITSLLDTAETASSAWGGDIGSTIGGFVDTIKSTLSSLLPSINGMVGKLIPGFSLTDDDAPQDDTPSAEEQERIRQQKEQAAELQRKQELTQEQQQKRDAPSPSPDTSQDEFQRVRDPNAGAVQSEQDHIQKGDYKPPEVPKNLPFGV